MPLPKRIGEDFRQVDVSGFLLLEHPGECHIAVVVTQRTANRKKEDQAGQDKVADKWKWHL